MYIWQLANWTNWDYDSKCLNLQAINTKQATLYSKMISIGLDIQNETLLSTLTEDVVKTSAIEGELYNPTQVRSSIAFRLGIDIGSIAPVNRNIDGVVEMTLDAVHNYEKALTLERLFAWHYALFPYGRSGLYSIAVGKFRDDSNNPMQVVSGSFGKEKIHYEAPPADRLEKEMSIFLDWYNNKEMDYIIKAPIAHLWFVIIHPFDDGNGRIARAITDMQLAKGEKNSLRFYSLSSQIEQHRNSYYEILERQKDSMDITSYLEWFISMLDNALINTEHVFERINGEKPESFSPNFNM